jgi:hypothetical protein
MWAIFRVFVAIVFGSCAAACVHPSAIDRTWYVGATRAPDPSRVAGCRSEEVAHAGWTFGGVAFGALAGAGGTVAGLVDDKGAKVGLAIESALAGLLAAASGGLSSFEASLYAADDCQAVLTAAP